jgi:hypothetical protein
VAEIENLTAAELETLEACKTGEEWEAACSAVKKARGGQYPPDWWPEMKLSGRMDRILARFGETSDLRFEVL